MGLMISSIAKLGKSILPRNMFKTNSDYYLYIIEYANFEFQEPHNYSSELHSSGMSRILNNYQYSFENINFEKLDSKTFHGETVMTWDKIFDINNDVNQTKISPAFLLSTIEPGILNKITIESINNEEFIFLRIIQQFKDANRVPQLVNDMLTSIGNTISNCKQSSVGSSYENVYVFDYLPEVATSKNSEINTNIIMGDNIQVGDITNNSGSINVGKSIKTETKSNENDSLARKSFNWQKLGIITTIIIGVIGIIFTYLSFIE